MRVPELVVLDVNETLSDLEPLRTRFTDVGAPAHLLETWFAGTLRDGFALAAAGSARTFPEVGAAVLTGLLSHLDSLTVAVDDAVRTVLDGVRALDVHPDVPAGLCVLSSAGVRVVTLTNGSLSQAEMLLERAGVADVVDRRLSVDDAGRWKPHPSAYRYVAEQCAVPLERCAMVAVHPWDLNGASAVGMTTGWIDRHGTPWPDVFTGPDVTGSTLRRGRAPPAHRMRIDLWSDLVCPWCAIGKAHLSQALATFEHADDVTLVWRSFELDPGAPAVREGEYSSHLARRYGASPQGGKAMVARISAAAERAGVQARFDLVRPANTFDAHRLLHLASEQGVQDRLASRLMRAYLAEGEVLSDHGTLQRLAAQVGLASGVVAATLSSGAYSDDVRADEADAGQREITAVPTLLIDDRHMIPGAQSPESMLATLRQARSRQQD